MTPVACRLPLYILLAGTLQCTYKNLMKISCIGEQ
jgi:hypothetical protein